MASVFDNNPTAAAPPQQKVTGDGYAYSGELRRFVECDGRLLTASRGGELVVAAKQLKDGSVRELPGESFVDDGGRHVVHLLDVQGELEAFVLLVVVQQADSRIVSVKKL